MSLFSLTLLLVKKGGVGVEQKFSAFSKTRVCCTYSYTYVYGLLRTLFLYVQLWAAFKRPITRCRRLLDCFNPISARAPGCISADPSIRLMGGGFSSEVDWKSEIDLTHWRPYAVFSFTVVFTSYLHHFSLPSPPLPPEQG